MESDFEDDEKTEWDVPRTPTLGHSHSLPNGSALGGTASSNKVINEVLVWLRFSEQREPLDGQWEHVEPSICSEAARFVNAANAKCAVGGLIRSAREYEIRSAFLT